MKKYLIALSLIATFVLGGYSQASAAAACPAVNTWTQKANFGGAGRYGSVGFSIGTQGYVGIGSTSAGYTNDFWQYDQNTNTWTQKANFGGGVRYAAVGFSIGNYGYVGTGSNNSGPTNDFWQYNPATNTWTQKASLGGAVRYGATAFEIGGEGYVGTGYNSTGYLSDFWKYNPTTNTWTQKANFGGTPRYMATGFSINNYGYIGVGSDNANNQFTTDFWQYDPVADIWTSKANFGGTARYMASGFSIGNYGFIGTGINGNGLFVTDFWQYDQNTNTWTQKANFGGTARYGAATGFAIGTKGYIGLGSDVSGLKTDFWQYCQSSASTITSSAGTNGTITPAGSTTVNYGASQTYTITPAAGYHTASILVDGVSVTVAPTYTFSNVIADHTISVTFIANTYTITASAGANGTVTPAGVTSASHGSNQTYTITPNSGYSVTSVLVDGLAVGSFTSYTFSNITSNHAISATFGPSVLACTPGNNWTQETNLTGAARINAVSFSIGTDGYLGTGSSSSAQGSNDFWKYDAINNVWTQKASLPGAPRSYAVGFSIGNYGYIGTGETFTPPYNAISIKKDFWRYDPSTNTWMQKADFGGPATHSSVGFSIGNYGYIGTGAGNSGASSSSFTIAASAGTNGTVTPAGVTSYGSGSNASYTFTPSNGYAVANVIVDGVSKGPSTGWYFPNLNASHTLSVVFAQNYVTAGGTGTTITATAGAGGTISPAGATVVTPMGSQMYTITPNPQYAISNVTVDGVSKGEITNYTFLSVSANHTISATFVLSSSVHTITASAGAGGTITSPGATSVIHGGTKTYSIVPASGFSIASVLIDGVASGTLSTYTFPYLTANHTISATFAGAQSNFWQYNPATDTWTSKASFGGGYREGAVGFSIGNYGYLGTGYVTNGTTSKNDFWQYNPTANTWIQKADVPGLMGIQLPGWKRSDAIGFAVGNFGYIGGGNGWDGFTSGIMNDFWQYNPTTNTWAQKVNTPGGARWGATAFAIGTKGFISTGTLGGTQLKDLWSFCTTSSYTITATASAGGAISPGGVANVNSGGSQTYTITPNAGYAISDVLVNGVSVGAVTTYPFTNVTSNKTIHATFVSSVPTFTITASSGSNGTITPTGVTSVLSGGNQTYTITPSVNYHVANVLVNGVSVGAVTSYQFTNVTSNQTISVTFAVNASTYTITATTGTNGSVTPAGVTNVNAGGSQSYTIAPYSNYHVVDVLVDGVSQGAITSYTFTNVNSNHTISATFAVNAVTYTITATAGTNGSISSPGVTTVNSGANKTYTITPNNGYSIATLLIDGVSVAIQNPYSFTNVTSNRTISVTFAPTVQTYTITATQGTNGTVSPIGVTTVNSGGGQTYTITPFANYHIATLLIDGVSVTPTSPYVFSNVTSNKTIHATFAVNATTYMITSSTGSNGTITPLGTTTVNSGVNQTYTITANANYHIASILVDGVSVTIASTYTFTNVTSNHTISVTFAVNTVTYTITASSGSNGTVTPPGVTTVNSGGNQTYTITPNSGYAISNVVVNGASVGAVSTYAFTNVTSNKTISATFVFSPTTYTITASSGSNGTITPPGVTTVNSGGGQAYTITASNGYHVQDVLVNGTSVGAVTTYPFTNVTSNQTISATFAINVLACGTSNTWTQKASFGGVSRSYTVGFSIGGDGYMGTGSSSSGPTNDFWKYNQTTNSWTQQANFAGGARYSATGFSIGNYGYIGSGYDASSNDYKDLWQYDPATNAWTQKTNFGGITRYGAVGFSIGNLGYVGTGFNTSNNAQNDFWQYDPSTNAWTQKANFTGAARFNAAGFSVGTKGYVGAGDGNSDFWEYDQATNTWSSKANFGGARSYPTGFSIGSYGYIGTGFNTTAGTLSKDFWQFNPSTNTWTQKSDFGGGDRYAAGGFSIGTSGYIGTGFDSNYLPQQDIWEYCQ